MLLPACRCLLQVINYGLSPLQDWRNYAVRTEWALLMQKYGEGNPWLTEHMYDQKEVQ